MAGQHIMGRQAEDLLKAQQVHIMHSSKVLCTTKLPSNQKLQQLIIVLKGEALKNLPATGNEYNEENLFIQSD